MTIYINIQIDEVNQMQLQEHESFNEYSTELLQNFINQIYPLGMKISYLQKGLDPLSHEMIKEEILIKEKNTFFSEIYLVCLKNNKFFSKEKIASLIEIENKLGINCDNLIKDGYNNLEITNLEKFPNHFLVLLPIVEKNKNLGSVLGLVNQKDFNLSINSNYNYQDIIEYSIYNNENNVIFRKNSNENFKKAENFVYNFLRSNLANNVSRKSVILENKNVDIYTKAKINIAEFYFQVSEDFKKYSFLALINLFLIIFISYKLGRKYERELYSLFNDNYIRKIDKKYFSKNYSKLYLMIIDIKDFSRINKEYGHLVGDKILTLILKEFELLKKKNESDIFYIGGDNFLIVSNFKNWQVAKKRFEELRNLYLNFSFYINNHSINIDFNYVLYQFDKEKYNTIKKLEKHIIVIEEIIKKRFKTEENDFLKFKNFNIINTIYGKQEKMKDFLQNKISENKLIPYIQPIICLKERKIRKYEVLMRLQGENEVLSPYPYIKIAEQNNMIKQMDYILINNTMNELKSIGLEIRIAFNLSSNELEDINHIRKINRSIEKSGYPKNKITFELTETSKISNYEGILESIKFLKQKNYEFAFDDFGTGHSNFEILKMYKNYCDYIKIDGLFIKDIEKNLTDQFLVKSIVNLAKAYEMKVIAEYVENISAEKIIDDLNVDFGQGYHYSKPFPLESVKNKEGEIYEKNY
ncbi:MAG: EAL domain-containing protein [Bacillota bacterium]